MKEIQTVLTRKGQTTIPIEIRRTLGLKEGDYITFVIEADRVLVQRAASVVVRTAGACRSARPPMPAEDLRDAAERAIAEETLERQGA